MSVEKPTDEVQSISSSAEREPTLREYFPTTVEQVKEGVQKFIESRSQSAVFRKVTEEKPDLLHAVAGLKPEIGFYWNAGFDEAGTPEEKEELKRVYEEKCSMKVFVWKTKDGESSYSLLNPKSVERVIRNCPIGGVFPKEALDNPVEWVMRHPEEWFERTDDHADPRDAEVQKTITRFGILSGYPPYGSAVYPEYIIADTFVRANLSDHQRVAYNQYIHADRQTRKFPRSVEKKLSQAVAADELTKHQADLVRRRFQFPNLWSLFGSGFSDEDEQYFKEIERIGKETGIDVSYSKDFFVPQSESQS